MAFVAAVTGIMLVLVGCGDDDVKLIETPDLSIWPSASALRVTNPEREVDLFDREYELSVNVINPGAIAGVKEFDIECLAIGTDSLGTNPEPATAVKLHKGGLTISTFDAIDVVFQTFKWTSPGPVTGYWKIDCEVDPAGNVVETDEGNNKTSLFFEAYCTGTLPCNGDPQSG